jgi:hypothetical protein
MKNELIIAEYKDLPRRSAEEKLKLLLSELGLNGLEKRFLS